MLTFIPAGTPASDALLDELMNGCLRNQDGFGYTIVSDDRTRLITYRSMDAIDALESFEKDRAENMAGPALFHSRWGTHGEESIRNVHPFPVGKDRDTVVAHNGVLPVSTWPSKSEWRSDTGVFAKRFLPNWGANFDREKFQNHVLKFIGRGNKLVVLTVNPRYENNVYLFNEAMGTWSKETGVWHSNHDYMGIPRVYMATSNDDGNWWNEDRYQPEYMARAAGNDGMPKVLGYRDDKPSVNGLGIDPSVRTQDGVIVPGKMSPEWLPGRQVERYPDVSEWTPFSSRGGKTKGQRILTEADVLAAHGYVPESLDEMEPLDESICPTCYSTDGFSSEWRVCQACGHCADCRKSLYTDDCDCYMPAHVSQKFIAEYQNYGH